MKKVLKDSAPTFTLDYKAEPTAALFHKSGAFVRGLRGPIGSGIGRRHLDPGAGYPAGVPG